MYVCIYYRAVVNGAHRDGDLQTHMHRYIENFVLCKNCRLPETHYKIKEGLVRTSMIVDAKKRLSYDNMYVCMYVSRFLKSVWRVGIRRVST